MSLEINISNYEEYAMDCIDGTLSHELKTSFDSFLILNPEIADEIDALRDFEKLEPSLAPSFDKNALKVNFSGAISNENYEDYLIASVEGELNEAEEKAVQQLVASNPIIEKDYSLYKKSIISPDMDVVYPAKSSLRKAIPLWQNTAQVAYRVAAVLIVALGGMTIWNVINEEMYVPRNGMEDFTAIEIMLEQKMESAKALKKEPLAEKEVMKLSKTSSQSSLDRAPSLKQISALYPEIAIASTSVKERTTMTYQPEISEWVGDDPVTYASANNSEALNLNQFIGKQFFGLDPEKTPTTLALMKEGLVKTISDRENVALNTSSGEDSDKKTIEFLAGNFGFKRVNYK